MKVSYPVKERRKSASEELANFDTGSNSEKQLSAVILSESGLGLESKSPTL